MTFTLTDPSGRAVSTLEKHIGPEVSKEVDELTTNSTSTLQTGVWKTLVQTDGKEIADLTFLVLPLSDNAGHWNGKDDKESVVADIDALTAQFWRVDGLCSVEDIGSECPNIELCSSTGWSSMSPDPKSDFIIDNEIKSAK